MKDIVVHDALDCDICVRSFEDETMVISGPELDELCSGKARTGRAVHKRSLIKTKHKKQNKEEVTDD